MAVTPVLELIETVAQPVEPGHVSIPARVIVQVDSEFVKIS
jgi:hypothetical protein